MYEEVRKLDWKVEVPQAVLWTKTIDGEYDAEDQVRE